MEKKYEIGGKAYVQRPLVLGQVRQLTEQLEGVSFNPAAGPAGIVSALGDRLHLALAVVLTPSGTKVKDKDIPTIADDLEFSIELEQIVEVVEDFFDCNPVASIFEKLTGMGQQFVLKMQGLKIRGWTPSLSPSPAETSPAETASCGATPQPSASPGSGTEAES